MDELQVIASVISFLEKKLKEAEAEAATIQDRFGKEAADGYRRLFEGVEEKLSQLKAAHKQLLH